MFKKIALSLSYCGTNYSGWQKQFNLATIEQYVEEAVSKIANHKVKIIAAGRTDKGVHAVNQIVHFDTKAQRENNSWIRGVNSYLPKDIVIHGSQEVNMDFHARFSAIKRRYRYILYNNKIRPCLLSGKVGWTFIPLDLDLIRKACSYLVGEIDFSSFRSTYCQAKSPIKIMYDIKVHKRSNLIFIDFEANGFLHHMVRNIIGTLILVGSKKMALDELINLITIKNRKNAPPTFMPDGLYLTDIIYPERFNLKISQNHKCFYRLI